MKRETLKEKIFRIFGKELTVEGSTKANTKVEVIKSPKVWGNHKLTFLGKIGRRFVALVPKVAGAIFVILVSIAPLIPKDTPILVPRDNTPVMTSQDTHTLSISDFAKFPDSGTLQIYVSQYGIKLPPAPKPDATYDIYPGTYLSFVPNSFAPPANYIMMKTGSLLG